MFCYAGVPGQGKITRVLTDNGWQVYFLPRYADPETDAVKTAEIAENHHAGLVVTDLCHRYCIANPYSLVSYHRQLKQLSYAFVLSIEDCRMSGFRAMLLLSGIQMTVQPWKPQPWTTAGFWRGHAILSVTRNFPVLILQGQKFEKNAHRILVCIGGSDPKKVTLEVVKAIKKLDIPAVKTRVITGSGMSKSLTEDIDRLAGAAGNIDIIKQTNEMVDQLNWADIAVVGEGLLKYEAAITGTPSLMIPQFDHDSIPIMEFLKIGCSRCINTIEETGIARALSELLQNHDTRKTMSANGLDVVDGKGMQRIYSSVLKELFKGRQ